MSEEKKTIELKEEDLEKVAGGFMTETTVSTLNGYSVGDSHTISEYGGTRTVEIKDIDKAKHCPYYVHQHCTWSNGYDAWGYWSLSEIQEFWSKVSAAVDPTGGPKSGSGVASF